MSTIAFVGLGRMGGGMAANLARSGARTLAYDLSSQALERAKSAGCEPVASVAEAVRDADAVITMLPAGPDVRSVYAEAVLPSARPGALLIDCSTVDVDTARSVAEQGRGKGFRPADAPVSGGIMAADAGTLAFMVGCDDADYADVATVLKPMSKAVIHAGASGAGQAAKICNNMLLGISMIGVCEAFALAEKLGLAADRFQEIASQSSGQCWSLSTYCPVPGVGPTTPADNGYEGGFLTALMLKDLKLSQQAAQGAGAVTPLGAEAAALYALFEKQGFGGKDFSAILQMLRGDIASLNQSKG